jgi:hypothetical protein
MAYKNFSRAESGRLFCGDLACSRLKLQSSMAEKIAHFGAVMVLLSWLGVACLWVLRMLAATE